MDSASVTAMQDDMDGNQWWWSCVWHITLEYRCLCDTRDAPVLNKEKHQYVYVTHVTPLFI
jgi:hypothetical protein